MTEEEFAEIEARTRVLPAVQSSYDLWRLALEPLTAGARRPFIPPERRCSLTVTAGDTIVLRIEDGRAATSTEPHLSSWLRAVEDRARLLEALHERSEELEECLRRMGGTW